MSERLCVVTYLIAVSVVGGGSLSASICLATDTRAAAVRQRYSDSAGPPTARHIRQIGINTFRGTCAAQPRSCPTADSKQPSRRCRRLRPLSETDFISRADQSNQGYTPYTKQRPAARI